MCPRSKRPTAASPVCRFSTEAAGLDGGPRPLTTIAAAFGGQQPGWVRQLAAIVETEGHVLLERRDVLPADDRGRLAHPGMGLDIELKSMPSFRVA